MPAPVRAVEAAEGDQGDRRGEEGHDHRDQLDQRGAGREPGVHVHRERQPGRRRPVAEVAEHAHDLRAEIAGEGTGDRVAGRGVQAHEFGGCRVDVRCDADLAAGARLHLRARRRRDGDVAVEHVHGLVRHPHEHRVQRGTLALRGRRGQQDPALRGQPGHRRTRDRRRQVDRDLRHQRCLEVTDDAVLRPVHRCGRLLHRHERRGHCQHESDEAGDDGDQTSGPVLAPPVLASRRRRDFGIGDGSCQSIGHGCRWYVRNLRRHIAAYQRVGASLVVAHRSGRPRTRPGHLFGFDLGGCRRLVQRCVPLE
ncbi:hypothetical protein MLGJGCBP_02715 [Rhodococcus sp. T7]|nr:hypothetical protein MLGJGCBP_02715 [Rhodococcus sp. T7]